MVTREELHRRLWPSDTFVDFDHSLNTAVMRLREVLSDLPPKIRAFDIEKRLHAGVATCAVEEAATIFRSVSLNTSRSRMTAVFRL